MSSRQFAFTGLVLLASLSGRAQTTALDGEWVLAIGEDPASYETVAVLQQDAGNTVKDEYATSDVTPRLMLQCVPGNADLTARIDWQRFISSFNTEVGFKVDDGKTLWLKWGVDRSNRVTLSPSTDDTAALLAALRDGTSLQVEVSPYSEPPITVSFRLDGLANGLARLATECS